ncbi:PPOX class F420-dependent oxidoreductase [Amycolatopsis sp. H20-H5]|uniref:PPOX class F420-dependent oxidoreductase n=1 Tax=Amycolatopsis sp. H20-H5 TaxID=3046309 RepID=UPI002DBD3062|nr:PPOX class F420-dependent oxidoreductase [Amycolatopsis sp. H20-H5]MEC3976681.1 PPOX class F420-dependent oxidoreductase [Amycolatopsis sp. H20-H5]
MHEMSRGEWWEFASAGTRTGKLGVTRKDGTPHVTPIWFLLNEADGHDELIFTTVTAGLKGKALLRDPRLCLCVDDQLPPYSFVQFTAEASLHHDLDEMRDWATRLGGRYMGAEQAEDYGKRNADPGESLVRAKITRVVARAGIAD